MIQEVQAYQDAIAAADDEYRQYTQAHEAAHEAAWTELGEADNAFVSWAVAQVSEHGYKRETLAILGALTTQHPIAQDVRDAARTAGYDTAVVDQAISRAIEAGVLSEGSATEQADGGSPETTARPQSGEARRRFLERVRSQFGRGAADEVSQTIDEILAEESNR
jgi:hypothetical protein